MRTELPPQRSFCCDDDHKESSGSRQAETVLHLDLTHRCNKDLQDQRDHLRVQKKCTTHCFQGWEHLCK